MAKRLAILHFCRRKPSWNLLVLAAIPLRKPQLLARGDRHLWHHREPTCEMLSVHEPQDHLLLQNGGTPPLLLETASNLAPVHRLMIGMGCRQHPSVRRAPLNLQSIWTLSTHERTLLHTQWVGSASSTNVFGCCGLKCGLPCTGGTSGGTCAPTKRRTAPELAGMVSDKASAANPTGEDPMTCVRQTSTRNGSRRGLNQTGCDVPPSLDPAWARSET